MHLVTWLGSPYVADEKGRLKTLTHCALRGNFEEAEAYAFELRDTKRGTCIFIYERVGSVGVSDVPAEDREDVDLY